MSSIFLSTPSARRATEIERLWKFWCKFLSTPSARRATLGGCDGVYYHAISIHALREEGDPFCPVRPEGRWRFLSTPSARSATAVEQVLAQGHVISIHALREEGDAGDVPGGEVLDQFLSTPSARRATEVPMQSRPHRHYFYPRPPRGGRRRSASPAPVWQTISIHALREEGDPSVT